ncbi:MULTISPECIES: hypothetical protein [Frankia]|uniref:Uncharacterized protein n=1 Tax=Frankia alni (strain DSM 45986 / CECT 9034 / ACN14a) TaxID=326424 RepID=Q0RQ02_FRAAA|nr:MULTISPECIES: hypothetical protein [Frankia]CAJ60376.1 hypothetical protein FRAAL1724 [Frankia alni ACN14a]
MITPYDHQAMWSKAKVFLNRAMDNNPERSFDEQAFWAAASLELLGKAALARVSPLLIADPTEDGLNILIATGLIEGTAKFTSVTASTIFKRCQRAFRPFNAADAQRFADARNEYLHGSTVAFMALPPQAYWPRFWTLASILVNAQDHDIDELVGSTRVKVVESYLEQNSHNIEHRTESLIERAKQRINQYRAGTLPAKIQAEWRANPDLTAGLTYATTQGCPACGGIGELEGYDSSDMTYEYHFDGDVEDPVYATATVKVPSDYFSCPTCHLVLDRYELIQQAGLPETFEAFDDDPPEEAEYGND